MSLGEWISTKPSPTRNSRKSWHTCAEGRGGGRGGGGGEPEAGGS